MFVTTTDTYINAIPVLITPRYSVPKLTSSANPNNLNFIQPSSPSPTCTVPYTPTRFALLNARSLTNKTTFSHDFIQDNNIDFFIVTESWTTKANSKSLIEATPVNYEFFHQPRLSGRSGGGLAVIHRDTFQWSPVNSLGVYKSFEMLSFLIHATTPLLCAVIYRPPKSTNFLDEFSEFLSILTPKYDHALILGDFNVHVCCPSHAMASDFINLIDSFNLVQSIHEPTHIKGHTLDLVLSLGISPSEPQFLLFPLSDHKAITFNVPLSPPITDVSLPPHRSRIINNTTAAKFADIFQSSASLPEPNLHQNPAVLVEMFNATSISILDHIAPFRPLKPRAKTTPWLTDHTRCLKRQCRKAERKYKHDNLHISLEILKATMIQYQDAVKDARRKYFSSIISNNSHNPRTLFKVINSLTTQSPSQHSHFSGEKCEEFLNFFLNKVEAIRSAILPNSYTLPPLPLVSTSLNHFDLVSSLTLQNTILSMKSSTCKLDPIPTTVLKEVLTTVLPHLLLIINSSLSTGNFPSAFKHAIVQPLLKKPNLDPSDLKNYRPISKLSFLSKVLEKIIYCQLTSYMNNNYMFEKFQSGFRALHSTETALVKVTNDLLLTIDKGDCAILILLDLSAAFDTVNHSILVQCLQTWLGLSGTALDLIHSYLTNRTFSVVSGDATSSSAPLTSGVPQGSVLGPLLFSIYMLALGHIIHKHNLHFHCYADDTQLYVPINSPTSGSLDGLKACLTDINSWMSQNFLQLNTDKTEILLFGPPNSTQILKDNLANLSPNLKSTAKNLGVYIDSDLNFNTQIKSVVQTCFFQLRNIAKIKPFLSSTDLEKVIHAFITSRIDYCNSLYSGITQKTLFRLQLVQNAAARLLTNTKKRDHITPILAALHWLPVAFRIDFKILLIAFKAQRGLAPPYISELLSPYIPPRDLRSSGKGLLEVRTASYVTKGQRAFAVNAPNLWNALPERIRLTDSLTLFKSLLKTYMFQKAFL